MSERFKKYIHEPDFQKIIEINELKKQKNLIINSEEEIENSEKKIEDINKKI